MDGGYGLPYRVGLDGAAGIMADGHEPPSGVEDRPPQPIPAQSRSTLNQQQLLELKPVIRRLYIEDGLKFVDVAYILKKDYNFSITLVFFHNCFNLYISKLAQIYTTSKLPSSILRSK